MTAQPLLSSTILKRVMTVFLCVLTLKKVMAPSNDNVLGLMRVMCGTRVTLLSFGTREYTICYQAGCIPFKTFHYNLNEIQVVWHKSSENSISKSKYARLNGPILVHCCPYFIYISRKELNWFFSWMNRSIPVPFQLSRNGSRSDQDPKKLECVPERELLRSVP